VLIEHAGAFGLLARSPLAARSCAAGQALAVRLWGFRVQGSQQALAGLLVQGQAVGALGEVILHFLVALGELLDQIAVLLKWVTTSF
jgi:hypothetical protein